MSVLKALFFLILIFFSQCTHPSKSHLEAEEAKRMMDSLRISTADSLLAQKKEKLDSIQQYVEKNDYRDGSLDKLISAIGKNNALDTYTVYDFSKKIEQGCEMDSFEANNHVITYKTCNTKGPFWSELTLDGRKILQSDLSPYDEKTAFSPEGFGTDLKNLKILKVGGNRFWELKGSGRGCVGSFCLWTFFILYDLERNRLYSFTAFSRGEAPHFQDLNEDGQIDFLELMYDYEGDHPQNLYGSNTLYIRAWTQNPQGEFELMKDSNNKVYQIKAHFEGGLFSSRNTRILEKHWMHPVIFP